MGVNLLRALNREQDNDQQYKYVAQYKSKWKFGEVSDPCNWSQNTDKQTRVEFGACSDIESTVDSGLQRCYHKRKLVYTERKLGQRDHHIQNDSSLGPKRLLSNSTERKVLVVSAHFDQLGNTYRWQDSGAHY